MTTTPLPLIHRDGGLLPSQPLAAIILQDLALGEKLRGQDGVARDGFKPLGERIGVKEASLRRIAINEQQTVTLDFADRYLCATGRQLRDVYPWLYTPEQIAADIAESDKGGPGIQVHHKSKCPSLTGGACECSPRYCAAIFHNGTRERRNFTRIEDARAWRQEWTVRA